jgi:hypothetical protein
MGNIFATFFYGYWWCAYICIVVLYCISISACFGGVSITMACFSLSEQY